MRKLNRGDLYVTALHSVPRTEAKGFGNCISVLSVERVWPALVFDRVRFSFENVCCNSQITCSVIARIAVIHWKKEVVAICWEYRELFKYETN